MLFAVVTLAVADGPGQTMNVTITQALTAQALQRKGTPSNIIVLSVVQCGFESYVPSL